MTEELKPCPFCGGNDLSIENQVVHPDNFHSAFVRCETCEMDGPSSLSLPEPDGCWMPDEESAKQEGIKAWNRRAQTEAEAEVARLRSALTSITQYIEPTYKDAISMQLIARHALNS